jgi:hypothetical protein
VRARPAATQERGAPQGPCSPCKVGKAGPRADPLQPSTVVDYESRDTGELRDCDPPPVKTCFAVGAVILVCEVFRFVLEDRSLGVTLVLVLLVRAGSVISRLLLRGREEARAVSIFAAEVSIACAA